MRYDLEDDEARVEYEFLSDNFDRRQMTPIDIARCYRRLKEMEQQKSDGKRTAAGTGNLRDLIGRKFNMSGRNLERLVEILDTPEEIQQSVARKLLPQSTARKIARLPPEVQQDLAHEIGEWLKGIGTREKHQLEYQVKGLAKQYLSAAAAAAGSSGRIPKRKNTVTRSVAEIEKHVAKLSRVFDRNPSSRSKHLPKCKQLQTRLRQLIAKMESTEAGE